MKVIVVTGAAGFIGSNLAEALLKSGGYRRVVGIDNFDPLYPVRFKKENVAALRAHKRFAFYKADIRNAAAMQRIFAKEKPEAVVHLAAKADTRGAVIAPREYLATNIDGTLNLLECARQYGVKKFIFASSSSVYGNNNKAPFTEDANTDTPLSPYGASKKAGELLAYTYHHNFGLPVVCIRIFNAYGPRMRPGLVLYRWVEDILRGKTVELSGRGTRKRDYTYIDDLVRAFMLALKKNIGYEIINIGNSRPVTLNRLLAAIERATGTKAQVRSRPSHHASVELTHASTAKAKRVLGWKPRVGITEGVTNFVSWFRRERFKKAQ